MLWFHNIDVIWTALIHISVTMNHESVKQLNRPAVCFTRKSISRQSCIFNPVSCKQKLSGEMMKHTSNTRLM